MYSVDNLNYLHIKFINYCNYSLYKHLIKKVCKISNSNSNNLYIKLNLDDLMIIANISSKLEFNKIFYNFENLLNKNNIGIKDIDYQNILVVKNILNNQYIVFGLILKRNKNDINVFGIFNNTYQNSIYKDLKYLIFFDKIDNNVIDQLSPFLYNLSISIISNQDIKSKFPIYTMQSSDYYLKDVFNLLNLNKKHILDFDLIVINKSVFFDSIFSENILSLLNNYYISGFDEKKQILENDTDKNLIKNLVIRYPQNQFNLENIYCDYDFIIISSHFLYNIIEDLTDKNIIQITIVLNFYKYIY